MSKGQAAQFDKLPGTVRRLGRDSSFGLTATKGGALKRGLAQWPRRRRYARRAADGLRSVLGLPLRQHVASGSSRRRRPSISSSPAARATSGHDRAQLHRGRTAAARGLAQAPAGALRGLARRVPPRPRRGRTPPDLAARGPLPAPRRPTSIAAGPAMPATRWIAGRQALSVAPATSQTIERGAGAA